MSEQQAKLLVGMSRRRHIRMPIMGLAELALRGGQPESVYLACIGRGGVGFYIHSKIEAEQLVVLSLNLSEEKRTDTRLKVAGRVRWIQPASRLYMVGLKFEKMSDERYSTLLKQLHLMKKLQF